ncbi:MAG TPA: glycine betaine ABC transporter substrate-binding protein [Ardenticatenaceae bacterium]|nr:glycine betaine ABC transporter substrate-binding protein [Ardenticatenaceae bacterium]
MFKWKGIRSVWLLLLILALLLAACNRQPTGGGADAPEADDPAAATQAPAEQPQEGEQPAAGTGATIAVGSKNFTEEFILGEMYAILLEEAGFTVERKLDLGATPIAHEALLNGDIDLYPEYTSTALLTVLKADPMTDRGAIYEKVKNDYEQQFQLTWLDPAPFNNTQALATTQEVSEEHGIQSFSDLAEAAPNLAIGGPPEFFAREDGLPGLQGAYGGFEFSEERQLDPGLRYEALLNGDIDVVVAFGTDGQIGGYDLVRLEDDKNFYPPYPVAPVVRMDTLEANPGVADALNALAPLLTDQVMADLNWMVDGPEKMEPDDVARQFLVEQGLIEG